jgi:hypothetical protein
MRALHLSAALAGAAMLAFGLAGCATPAKTAGANARPGDSWASIAKLPDWQGLWSPDIFNPPKKPGAGKDASAKKPAGPPAPPPPPPFTPEYLAKYQAFLAKNKGTPGINFVTAAANCVPYNMPGSMHLPYPVEFFFTPGRVTIAMETDEMIRRVYTDGRAMPKNLKPTYQGYSVGHWEGDTLVVDTAGIMPGTSVVSGVTGHGPDLNITERMHLVSPDIMEVKTTITDPTLLTKPYTTTSYYRRHRDWDMMEYVCSQNNHDGMDSSGKATFSLHSQGY